MTAAPRRPGARRRALAVLLTLAALGIPTVATSGAGAARPDPCDLDALADREGPVRLDAWHHLVPADAETLQGMVDDFNATHRQVQVTVQDENPAARLHDDFFHARASSRPALAMLDGRATRPAIDGRFVAPVQPCLDASGEQLDDLLAGPRRSVALGNVQWAVPFGASAHVLLYDRAAFARAGLDADAPPDTLAAVSAASRAITTTGAAGAGIGVVDPAPLYLAAGSVLDERIDQPITEEVLGWLADAGPARELELLPPIEDVEVTALADGRIAMTIVSTTMLPRIARAVQQGQAPGLDLRVAAVPTPVGPAVPYESVAWFIGAHTSPVERAAAWTFLDWMSEPAQQARVGAGTDFFPARPAAADTSTLADRWTREPLLGDTWTVLRTARAVPQPVTAPLVEYREELTTATHAVHDHGVAPGAALAEAARRAAADRAGYLEDPARYARCRFAEATCIHDDDLYRVSADGTRDEPIATRPGPDAAPTVSPDGTKVAFASGLGFDRGSRIYTRALDGRRLRALTDGTGFVTDPAWSPDGSRILYTAFDDRTGNLDLWLMDASGRNHRRVTTTDTMAEQHGTWAPDGTRIAYTRRADSSDVWVADADGGNARAVTSHPADDLWPTWSPDGRSLAYASIRDGRPELFVVDLDTGEERRVGTGIWMMQPAWSPDGTGIAVIDLPSHEVYVASPDGATYRRLTTSLRTNWQPTWTPDGSAVIVVGGGWPAD